jgi:LmbE family N-acetylglucosaminyl deacetylase
MKVLVFCAHADDEVIGIGGTLRKLANAGAAIRLVMFSEGAEGYTRPEEKATIVARRHRETKKVCEILGIGEYINLGGLDWGLKVDNASYRDVVRHVREFRPDVVFTHGRADYNDHKAVHDVGTEGWFHAAVPCAMGKDPIWPWAPLYEFEVLEAMPQTNLVVDITDTYAAKVEAMKCYESQQAVVGGVFQLMEGRALERGYLIGAKYSEALYRTAYRPRAVRDVRDLCEGGGR